MWLVFFFFFLPAMCSVSFYSEISLRFQLNLPSLRMHCNTPRGSLRTDSLEKRGSHSWPVTMEADAVFVLPCLPLCSLELLPIVKRGYASILLHHDRLASSSKGMRLQVIGLDGLHGPESSLDVTLARSEPHHQRCICRLEGDIGDPVFEKKSVWCCHCAFSLIDRMNIEPSVVACVKQIA